MRKILSFTAFLLMSHFIFAQTRSLFLEFGGNGCGLSANFDSRFGKKENGFGYRVGIGFAPGFGKVADDVVSLPVDFTIPIGINHLAGKGPHYFESGLGLTFISGSEVGSGNQLFFIPNIGYRYAKIGKGFQGRIVTTPLIGSGGIEFYLGASVGFKF
jgi:hypothetical protein